MSLICEFDFTHTHKIEYQFVFQSNSIEKSTYDTRRSTFVNHTRTTFFLLLEMVDSKFVHVQSIDRFNSIISNA